MMANPQWLWNNSAFDQIVKTRDSMELAIEAGEIVSEKAKQKAPVLSGMLRFSISVFPGVDFTSAYADVSWERAAFWGYFQELGTRTHPVPHRFLVPALDETKYTWQTPQT